MAIGQLLSDAQTSTFPEVCRVQFSDSQGDRDVSARLISGMGETTSYLTPHKVRDLWVRYSEHDVLFSDHTRGKLEPFLLAILDPRSYWLEFFDLNQSAIIGVGMVTDILPEYDAKGHFAFWDRLGSGREPLIWRLMEIFFDDFDLHRMSAETPAYQKGVRRFIKRLGFTEEGRKREAVYYHGNWVDLVLFGITRKELQEVQDERRTVREGEIGNS